MAPILSMAFVRLSRSCAGRMPGVTVMPDSSVILCVLTTTFSLLKVPALVLSTRWNVYSVSTANPLIFVVRMLVGLGMLPAFWLLRNKEREMQSAVASSIGSHSSTTEVWVAFLQRRTGERGSDSPKEV